jgi:enoyl-CoA hydratase/carnithine racemase
LDEGTNWETLLVDVDEVGVATITLNRPDKLNAITLDMDREFFECMRSLDTDPGVRVIVVTGAGRAFCAGVDMSEGNPFDQEAHADHDESLGTSSETIDDRAGLWRLATPIIGAINGAAVGAGLTIATLFDVNIAAEDAKLGFVFTRRGILPDASIHWLLPRLVGVQRALELLMTGRTFTGAEAAEMGLVLRAVPADQVLVTAQELARDIAVNTSPLAAGLAKRLTHQFLGEPSRGAAMRLETRLVWWSGEQPDAMEGVMSFMEKRTPEWKTDKHTDLPESIDWR